MTWGMFPAINSGLLIVLIILLVWRLRIMDTPKIWDEIEALKLRLAVQEKAAPCPHCRQAHGAIASPGEKCDEC